MSKSKLHYIGLQFFAEPNDPPADPPADPPQDPPADPPAGKTYSQEDVNRMLANEKRQGRQAALKALGLDPNDKDAEKKAKAILDAQKTEKEKSEEALNTEKTARTEAEQKALTAERKLTVLTSGCKKDFIDEVMALASVKVDDTTDFEKALEVVKEKCPAFFEDGEEGDKGTGGGQGHKRNPQRAESGSFGKKIAESAAKNAVKENPYFTD